MGAAEIASVFEQWNEGPLKSYLIEISGEVAKADDPKTGAPMIDMILDRAGQKGTGRWTAIEALHLGAPATAIEAAVAARNLSSRLDERAEGEAKFGAGPGRIDAGALDLGALACAPGGQDCLLRTRFRLASGSFGTV